MAYEKISLASSANEGDAFLCINESQKRTLTSVFHDADLNFKGFLTREDLKVATAIVLGYKPSKYEINQMYEKSGVDENSGVSMESFLDMMAPKVNSLDEDEQIRQMFFAFDTQCRGFIKIDDLRRIVRRIAPNLSERTLETAFREIDRDGDGRVSYKDFEFMMKCSLGADT